MSSFLAHYLWIFLILDVTLELLEIVSMKYESLEELEIINRLLSEKIATTFYGCLTSWYFYTFYPSTYGWNNEEP
jgi:hypothetical protein